MVGGFAIVAILIVALWVVMVAGDMKKGGGELVLLMAIPSLIALFAGAFLGVTVARAMGGGALLAMILAPVFSTVVFIILLLAIGAVKIISSVLEKMESAEEERRRRALEERDERRARRKELWRRIKETWKAGEVR